ncbi:MAG: hypothetical protein COA88_11335, partial [Kordia sp.]
YICHKKGKTDDILVGVIKRYGESFVKLYITKEDSLQQANNSLSKSINEMWNANGDSWVHKHRFSKNELNCLIEYLK